MVRRVKYWLRKRWWIGWAVALDAYLGDGINVLLWLGFGLLLYALDIFAGHVKTEMQRQQIEFDRAMEPKVFWRSYNHINRKRLPLKEHSFDYSIFN